MEDVHFTARELLRLLQGLDDSLLDAPLILVHGKGLEKPNLVHGFIPATVPCERATVEAKRPALLTLAQFR
jgi:hypothetical protein